MQVNLNTFCQCDLATNQDSLLIRIFLNNFTIEDSFHQVLTLKAFLQCMSHGMAFDEIVAEPDPLTNALNVLSLIAHANTFRIGSPPKFVSRCSRPP